MFGSVLVTWITSPTKLVSRGFLLLRKAFTLNESKIHVLGTLGMLASFLNCSCGVVELCSTRCIILRIVVAVSFIHANTCTNRLQIFDATEPWTLDNVH